MPGPVLTGHAATTVGALVWTFGGLDARGHATATLRTFDGLQWRDVDAEDSPSKRMYTSLTCVDENTLVACGGWDPGDKGSGGTFYDDVWRFCTATGAWSRSACTTGAPFSRHTAHLVDVGGGERRVLLRTFRCVDHVLLYDAQRDTMRRQPTTGDGPAHLSMQAGTVLGGTRVVLFGGSTREREMTADVFVLDTTTWVWRRFPTSPASGPSPRASAMLVAVDAGGGEEVLLFGGAGLRDGRLHPTADLWKMRLREDAVEWTELDTPNPAPRVAGVVSPHGTGSYVLHGGWDGASTFGDTWTLRVG